MNKKGGDSNMIGKILVNSWGYSMTIVDFYKVVKETNKSLLIQKIGSKEKEVTGYLSGTVMPDPENELKEYDPLLPIEERKLEMHRVYKRDRGYFIGSLGSGMMHHLIEWDGKPENFNHCD